MLPWDTIMLMLSFIIQEGLWGELMDSALALVSRVFTRAIRKSRAVDNADLLDDPESAESTTEIPSSSSEASNYGGTPSSAGSSAPLQSQATYQHWPHNCIKWTYKLPPMFLQIGYHLNTPKRVFFFLYVSSVVAWDYKAAEGPTPMGHFSVGEYTAFGHEPVQAHLLKQVFSNFNYFRRLLLPVRALPSGGLPFLEFTIIPYWHVNRHNPDGIHNSLQRHNGAAPDGGLLNLIWDIRANIATIFHNDPPPRDLGDGTWTEEPHSRRDPHMSVTQFSQLASLSYGHSLHN
jgi:hypothetical protein